LNDEYVTHAHFAIQFNVTPTAIREIIKNDGKIAKDSKYIS
jgi:hypothetical protein